MSKPTKTTTTTSLEERLAAAEAAHELAAQESARRVVELTADLASARGAVEDAEDELEEVEAKLAAGDDDTTGSDLASARVNVDAARLRVDRLTRQHKRAAMPINAQTDAALGAVPLVHAALPGVPVYVTAAPLPDLTAEDAPLAVLRQVESTVTRDGSQRGGGNGVKVELHYLRNITHREHETEALERLADRSSLRLRVPRFAKVTDQRDGFYLDRFTIESGETAPVPVVEETSVPGTLANMVGQVIAGAAYNRLHSGSEVTGVQHATSGDGIRTSTVTGRTALRAPSRPTLGAKRQTGSPTDLVDNMVYGLGRVIEVHTSGAPDDQRTWTLVLTSRVSHDVTHPAPATDEHHAA